ncbi:GIY-YIG nuclease family protein [Patescibacteria group bacterium]|nr:GIY-YIG nuclease family protein [Patescibacteria group bacterium]
MERWYIYIARCKDNSIYIGLSSNPNKRIIRHNEGAGALWIIQHGEAKIVYTEEYDNYLEARRREMQIKKWSRKKKEDLIADKKHFNTNI